MRAPVSDLRAESVSGQQLAHLEQAQLFTATGPGLSAAVAGERAEVTILKISDGSDDCCEWDWDSMSLSRGGAVEARDEDMVGSSNSLAPQP